MVTGKTIVTVIELMIAIVAIIVMWLILSGQLKLGAVGAEKVTGGFKCWACCDLMQCKEWSGQ